MSKVTYGKLELRLVRVRQQLGHLGDDLAGYASFLPKDSAQFKAIKEQAECVSNAKLAIMRLAKALSDANEYDAAREVRDRILNQ